MHVIGVRVLSRVLCATSYVMSWPLLSPCPCAQICLSMLLSSRLLPLLLWCCIFHYHCCYVSSCVLITFILLSCMSRDNCVWSLPPFSVAWVVVCVCYVCPVILCNTMICDSRVLHCLLFSFITICCLALFLCYCICSSFRRLCSCVLMCIPVCVRLFPLRFMYCVGLLSNSYWCVLFPFFIFYVLSSCVIIFPSPLALLLSYMLLFCLYPFLPVYVFMCFAWLCCFDLQCFCVCCMSFLLLFACFSLVLDAMSLPLLLYLLVACSSSLF